MSCVYFIQAGGTGPIKIGKTGGDPMRRLSDLQTGSPVPLRLIGIIETREIASSERAFHRAFESDRLHGEWFRPSRELVAELRKRGITAGDGSPGCSNCEGYAELAARAQERTRRIAEETRLLLRTVTGTAHGIQKAAEAAMCGEALCEELIHSGPATEILYRLDEFFEAERSERGYDLADA
jgi:hypothetical protein